MVRSVATIEAMCTKGPSLPSGIPEPNVAVRPTTFATSVLDNKDRFYLWKVKRFSIMTRNGSVCQGEVPK